MAKDLFSKQAGGYARYRPTYPQALFDYILAYVPQRKQAWDCATGSGQAARVLAGYFEEVQASDISPAQLANAIQKENIHYHVCPAEQTPFADNSFDLITVATAYHWLDAARFRTEVLRVARPGAVIAAWAYNLLSSEDEAITELIIWFCDELVKAYWDAERRHVAENYANIDFDYAELPSKTFQSAVHWSRNELMGYLETWSAVQNYIKANQSSPLGLLEEKLRRYWPDADEKKDFVFPVFLRLGRVEK